MKTKYPRSWHLNYSQKSSSDDRRHQDDSHFEGVDVVVTIKMDGENTTIYNDHSHARSIDSKLDTEDRRWIDALRKSKIEGNIPNSFRICGENMFYKHTCHYQDLESMFYVFSIWDNDTCLSWNETEIWCGLLELKMVPVIYEGKYNKENILESFSEYLKDKNTEGFVVRKKNEFKIQDFKNSLSKYVKRDFVIPDEHWRHSAKVMNKLKDGKNPWQII
jgi:hypothetical protein